MRQYAAIKKEHPNALLFFRLGDFYELFFDDAIDAATILDLALTSVGSGTGTNGYIDVVVHVDAPGVLDLTLGVYDPNPPPSSISVSVVASPSSPSPGSPVTFTATSTTGIRLVSTVGVPANYGLLPQRLEYLQTLARLCRKHGALFIADEVQSGMGRTGRMWASDHFQLAPDILTVAKGIASGMPLVLVERTAPSFRLGTTLSVKSCFLMAMFSTTTSITGGPPRGPGARRRSPG